MRLPVESFKGLNNVSDPLTLGLAWQSQADDVDVTQDGRIARRQGFEQTIAQTSNTGAYATKDEQRAYIVDSGSLKQINPDLTLTTLATGLNSARMYFDEINGAVFCTNGIDYKVISPTGAVKRWGVPAAATPALSLATGVLTAGFYRVCATLVDPDGVEGENSDVAMLDVVDGQQIQITVTAATGYTTNVYVTAANGTVFYLLQENATGTVSYSCLPDQLGREIRYWFTNVPRGTMPCFFKGQCYLAEYFPDQDSTALWSSMPLQFHHWDAGSLGMTSPGRVLMLKVPPDNAALIIGTDRGIHAWDGSVLTLLAPYGVVPGHHDAMKAGKLYFWTLRGLARAMPFENLTERTVSVAPGIFSGATVHELNGNVRYIVALQAGGTAYNART